MKMERIMIQLPPALKEKLESLRTQGYTTSGYIRALLERELGPSNLMNSGRTNQKGR